MPRATLKPPRETHPAGSSAAPAVPRRKKTIVAFPAGSRRLSLLRFINKKQQSMRKEPLLKTGCKSPSNSDLSFYNFAYNLKRF